MKYKNNKNKNVVGVKVKVTHCFSHFWEISTHALIFLKSRMILLKTLKLVELMTHSTFGEQHFSERSLPTLFLRGEQPSRRVLMAKT